MIFIIASEHIYCMSTKYYNYCYSSNYQVVSILNEFIMILFCFRKTLTLHSKSDNNEN